MQKGIRQTKSNYIYIYIIFPPCRGRSFWELDPPVLGLQLAGREERQGPGAVLWALGRRG